MITIIPAILETTESGYAQVIEKINHCAELTDGWAQIDFTDNKFVPNQTVGLDIVEKYPTNLRKEAHLMVEDPINWLDSLNKMGFERVLWHLETGGTEQIIKKAKSLGLGIGLVVNTDTALEKLRPFWSKVDVIQLMAVIPGLQGQEFITASIDRIKQLARLRSENEVHFLIGVDGGLNDRTIPEVAKAGADNLVIGSALVKGDINENLEIIWQALRG